MSCLKTTVPYLDPHDVACGACARLVVRSWWVPPGGGRPRVVGGPGWWAPKGGGCGAGGAELRPGTRLHGFLGPWYSRRSINIKMCICTFKNGCYRHESPIRGIRCPMEPKYQMKTFNNKFPLKVTHMFWT